MPHRHLGQTQAADYIAGQDTSNDMPHAEPTTHRPQPREQVFHGRDDWQAGLRQHLLPLQCLPVEAQGFRGSALFARLGGNPLAELRCDASRLTHRDTADGRGGPLQVLWQLSGRCHFEQGPQRATLEAGHWTVCDAGRAYAADFSHGARCLTMLVPRLQCGGWANGVDVLAALPLSAGGPAQVAKTLLLSLLHEGAPLDARSERALHDALVALVEQALQLELLGRGRSPRPRQPVDVARVQAYVLEHLADPALTVERLAAVFGVSRRSLYNVFAPVGVTPHGFIQQAKLDRASALLRDPDWRREPIQRIAEQCGFADPAHFCRAFHSRHGVAPTAWRGMSD